LREHKEDFYLAASRMVPYKKMALIVQAFAQMPDKRLIVIGDGPELARVREHATANITLLGYQPIDVLIDHMQRARAFVFAAEEDFGIMPLEAQACGTPVIAYGRGGSLETVKVDGDTRTGLFFAEQSAAAIVAAVQRFEVEIDSFDAAHCRAHAEGFSNERFRREMQNAQENF
jgi:glycosyltransferase involved in cell wall biosynthesis